jgi:Histidine kinase-, DNA gyrase B-, and HSP90-like ATPase
MTQNMVGNLSDLLLVRLHGRTAAYANAEPRARAALVSACRLEATVRDLPERILSRTIRGQTTSRANAFRELLQNAIDASSDGARVDVTLADGGKELVVADHGRGMAKTELIDELLVPFRSTKQGDPRAIGEHGIGFLAALEHARAVEITTRGASGGYLLTLRALGERGALDDFSFSLEELGDDLGPAAFGTTVRLALVRRITRLELAAEISDVAAFVDPGVAGIYVDGALVNVARSQTRHVAQAPVGKSGALGSIDLLLGRGQGFAGTLVVTQRGLFVTRRHDAFAGAERALQRDVLAALGAGGYGLVADLSGHVPLTKGRNAVAAAASSAVDAALVAAFERFVLEDALRDRELVRGVDHRLGAVIDRLVDAAIAGEPAVTPDTQAINALNASGDAAPPSRLREPKRSGPTVAAPENVASFAAALLEAPLFATTGVDPSGEPIALFCSLKSVLASHRAGLLRAGAEDEKRPGVMYLSVADPLGESLWRRLLAASAAPRLRAIPPQAAAMERMSGARLKADGEGIPGVDALVAALALLERIDAAIAQAAGLTPSPVSVHQDLYGPDEMAHTDGTGISVNVGSTRVRALLSAALGGNPRAFGALVDLLLHEKSHVALASNVPRATAEHGATFYRQKDTLRRLLLQAIAEGRVLDPSAWLPSLRRDLVSLELPAPRALAEDLAARRAA